MDKFEAILNEATAKGSNNVPGAAVAVVDQDGNYIYKNVKGFNGVAEDAKPLEFDQTYSIASATKLIASIAALQAVERGLVGLDDPIDQHLPELASQPVLEPEDGSKVETRPARKSITLRHLLTHSSGTAYGFMSPTLALWNRTHGKTPGLNFTGVVTKDCDAPRVFEAGESWTYGQGLDWASLLVARLNKTTFENYVEENISKPLGITSFTWHLPLKPHVAEKLMRISVRSENGKLVDGPNPAWPNPEEHGGSGGAGLYASVHDYTRVLADLLKESPVLLRKDTADLLFTPQFAEGSNALKGLYANGDRAHGPVVGGSTEGVVRNHGLGGLLVVEDVNRENYFKPKGSLAWSGITNVYWTINRERGLAFFFATQVLPWADEKSLALYRAFETAVWRNLSK